MNNAGAAIPDAFGTTGTDQGIDIYHKTLKLNLQAVIEMTKKVKPHLVASKGEIVNVSSIVAGPQAVRFFLILLPGVSNFNKPPIQLKNYFQQPDFLYYAIAKAALDQYTRSTAIDLAKFGIRVNSVSPGMVETGFTNAMGMPDQASQKVF